jgi:hypothetical protein
MQGYYRIIETNPTDWVDTETIIYRLGGTHYSTLTTETLTRRAYVAEFTDEALVMARLSLHKADIEPLPDLDYMYLKQLGYIK